MPELPEVETIRKGLEEYLVGHTIQDIEVKVPKMFDGDPKNIIGGKVTGARRFGKVLVIDLSNGNSLAIHVKLTGQLVYRGERTKNVKFSAKKVGAELPGKLTHVIFKLDKDAYFYYNDWRRFGWIKAVATEKVLEMPFLKGMGPEPFKDLTLEKFTAVIEKSNLPIKPLIMDQKKIGGIGNIYANDSLNLAQVDPRKKGKELTKEQVKKLYDAVHKVMEKGMKYGGSSELSYVNLLGQEGEYQRHTLVYGKTGKPCPNCGGSIKKVYLGGRGTFFCEKCQK